MHYSVRQLADIADISVRTLHHYDRIGLLRPVRDSKNDYRRYGQTELLRLQQILFWRVLEFPLKEIRRILDAPDFDPVQAMNEQKKMLELKKQRIEKLLFTLSHTMKQQGNLPHDQLFHGFSDEQLASYKREAKARWGRTNAWKQSQERTKNWTKDDYARVQKEGEAIILKIVKHVDKGHDNAEVQKCIAAYHQYLGTFYEVTLDIYRSLGEMYSVDPRFAAYYEKHHSGLAAFMTAAIAYYCDNQASNAITK